MPSANLPVVRLSLLRPLTSALSKQGVDVDEVLAPYHLNRSLIDDDDQFVPVRTMYTLVEDLSDASGDPFFGVHVGEALNPWKWGPLAAAAAAAATVGDFLLRYTLAASEDASSITFGLESKGPRSRFFGRRVTDADISPRHNDGFTIAYVLSIIRPAVGDAWVGSRVVVRVCDPSVIPPGYLGIRVAETDTLGCSVEFPAGWLLRPPHLPTPRTPHRAIMGSALPRASIVDALRQAIALHLHEPDLGGARVARMFGFSRRTLMRRLQEQGTTLSREMAAMRCERAQAYLRDSDLSIAAIGARVGYPNPAVFSRVFRRWTGQSPLKFRQQGD